MKIKIIKKRLILIFFILTFRILLDISYFKIVHPFYEYTGFVFEPEKLYWGITYLLLLFFSFILPLEIKKPSNIVINFLFIFIWVPAGALISYNKEFSFTAFLLLTISIVFITLFTRLNFKTLRLPRGRQKLFFPGLIFLSIIGYVSLIYDFGFKLKFLSFSDVYSARAEYVATSKNILSTYFHTWLGNVINPALFSIGFINKKYIILAFAFVGQFFVYSITGFKSVLFSFLFILWLWFGLKYSRKNFATYTAASFCGVAALALVMDALFFKFLFTSYLIRRVFFLPALLFYYYIEFFSVNPNAYFAQNQIFKYFVKNPYDDQLSHIIGYHYFDSFKAGANANLFADGFANLNLYGFLYVVILLVIVLSLIDNVTKKKNIFLVTGIIAMPVFSFTNSSIHTILLSHGLLLALLILAVMPYEKKY